MSVETSTVDGAGDVRTVVIDDTADQRVLLSLALAQAGFDVVADAADGRAGIEAVREHRPDLVLLDLSMPVMDGIEALPTIRRLCPEARIIVLSASRVSQMSARAVAAGADGYVQKGSSLAETLAYVQQVTGHAGAVDVQAIDVDAVLRSVERLQATPAAAGGTTARGSRPYVESAPPAGDPSAVEHSRASTREALDMAPFGLIELADEPLYRVVRANPMAQRLCEHRLQVGSPLSLVAVELAELVAAHRLDADPSFDLDLPGGAARATMRRTDWSLLVYLDCAVEDVGRLRRAIATTAHEIRGTVAVMSGIAETLAADHADVDEAQRERLVGGFSRQARTLDAITADLLTSAQIQRGTLHTEVRPVLPAQALGTALAGDYDVSVEVEDRRAVVADPDRLHQMLLNLVANAARYGRPPITVRVRGEGDWVCLDVVDRGEGVPEEFREELFREFARPRGAVATGTGLGLYVVRALAEAQGGSVAYSEHPGGGSVFTVRLRAA